MVLVSPSIALTGKVIKVTDGDSITILTEDKGQYRIRLYGIDCPERRQPFGSAATKFTRDAVAGKTVEVNLVGSKSWDRVVAIVGDLNENLVSAGLAWVWDKYCKKPVCAKWRELEKAARKEKRGLWKEKAVPPWEWRNETSYARKLPEPK